ncbi:MAG TPA: hypothetical protein VM848_16085 [Acidimicrobiia bacterium]|nr:hypothetical protein [Acidimicrobiia bacterium]
MDFPTLQTVVHDAVALLLLEQWELHHFSVGERTITSQLLRYMCGHAEIPAHLRVDHEYNRHEGATKRIRWQIGDEGLDPPGERHIFPDVVLHRRGDDKENWLVLEAKRGATCDYLDRMKVEALIEQYDYRWEPYWPSGWEPTDGILVANGLGPTAPSRRKRSSRTTTS